MYSAIGGLFEGASNCPGSSGWQLDLEAQCEVRTLERGTERPGALSAPGRKRSPRSVLSTQPKASSHETTCSSVSPSPNAAEASPGRLEAFLCRKTSEHSVLESVGPPELSRPPLASLPTALPLLAAGPRCREVTRTWLDS